MIMNQIVSGEGGGGLDTYDATAYPEHILDGYTAYARGAKITGTFGGMFPLTVGPGEVHRIVLQSSYYLIKCYGGQGGYRSSSTYGGKGGYAEGVLHITEPTEVFIRAGGSGNFGGYNGGGERQGTHSDKRGGGASDVRVGTDSLYARVIVAGGGGSDGAADKPGAAGGGLVGNSATQSYGSGGQGGTQTAAGSGGSNIITAGLFGIGGTGISSGGGHAGAGGGGWFGGAGSQPDGSRDDDRGGGGGSGYVHIFGAYEPEGYLLSGSFYLLDTVLTSGVHEGEGKVIISLI